MERPARCSPGAPGEWDARGPGSPPSSPDPLTVLYDGRRDAASNWFESTGMAVGRDRGWCRRRRRRRSRSPYADGAFRYACAVPLADGGTRYYFEAARDDGAHDLLTFVR